MTDLAQLDALAHLADQLISQTETVPRTGDPVNVADALCEIVRQLDSIATSLAQISTSFDKTTRILADIDSHQ